MKDETLKEIKAVLIVVLIFLIFYLVISDLTTEHVKIFYDRVESYSVSYNENDEMKLCLTFHNGKHVCINGDNAKIWNEYDIDNNVDIVGVTYSESKIGSGKLIFIEVVHWKESL